MRRMVLVLAAMAMAAAMAVVGLVGTGYGLFSANQRADAQSASRPNIVFVMTDDLDERSMQDLPGITRDVMGSNGITFENAYVTYPLCCPSRATFLRGQYPHNHDIIHNVLDKGGGEQKFRQLGLDQSTIATWLKNAGYRTGYIGKYLNNYEGTYIPPGWDEWFVLNGATGDPFVNDNGQSITIAGNSTDVFAEEASNFITTSSANPEPFFAVVGTHAPHVPPPVAERHQGSFAQTPLPKPENFDEANISDKPRWLQQYPRLTQAQIADLEQEYRERLRSMLAVEDLLREIVATLQETSELDNTYIFFTSDNGYHMGNHRLYPAGKLRPYEEDIGVPLMVRGPGVPAGAVRKELVINNDLAPTIADLADAAPPTFVDGSSFAPLLTNSLPPSWRTAFLEEVLLSNSFSRRGVHTQRYMFTEYTTTGERELYDLSTDPYQLQSMPRAGNEQLYSELGARLNSLRNCSGAECRTAEGFGTTTTPPDTTAPQTSISPTSGPAEGSSTTSTSATFAFSSDEQGSTFKCQLSKDGTVTQAWADCTSPKSYSNLAPGTYKFEVQATDPAGNVDATPEVRTWTITSPSVDTTAPTVTSTVPTANATGVAPTANVTATFSEEMDSTTINANTFKLTRTGSNTKITAAVSYPDPNSPPRTAKLDPANSLQRGVTYRAIVTTGAKDAAGNSLDQNSTTSGSQQMVWFFTVR